MHYRIALALVFGLAGASCTKAEEPPPGYLDIADYDRSCTSHDDCRWVDLCACDCVDQCPSDDAVNASELDRIERERESFFCPDKNLPAALSCAIGNPVCVENTCESREVELPDRTAGGPDTWDRACSTNTDCVPVWVNRCALHPECSGELRGVTRDDAWKARAWNFGCDVLQDDYTTACDDIRYARLSAYCDASNECQAAIVKDEPPEDVDCSTLSTDGLECLENGCSEFIIRGAKVEEDECVPQDVILCVEALGQGVTDETPGYDRDGTAFHWPYPDPPPGAVACRPNPSAACECLPYY